MNLCVSETHSKHYLAGSRFTNLHSDIQVRDDIPGQMHLNYVNGRKAKTLPSVEFGKLPKKDQRMS